MRTVFVRAFIASIALLIPFGAALAQQLAMTNSRILVDGRNAKYIVHFNGPIDHRQSQLYITQGDKTVMTLRPLLTAEPTVLAASAPMLEAGSYHLRWSVKPMRGSAMLDGAIAFTAQK